MTVRRLLMKMKYSLKANVKRLSGTAHPDRNQQFEFIERQKQAFLAAGWPVISVDTKKKELIGNFKNAGKNWCLAAEAVNDHDFDQDALGKAVPYGIYDLNHNLGYVYVGNSADTPQFAVEMIASWWQTEGQRLFPGQTHILILADAGGSNGCRPRLWKQQLQEQLADRLGLAVTVCHYPTGASKWNPIEHRLFCFISLNWAGQPLVSYETILKFIRTTRTESGLWCQARLDRTQYKTGLKITADEKARINLKPHRHFPNWNYTIKPHSAKFGK